MIQHPRNHDNSWGRLDGYQFGLCPAKLIAAQYRAAHRLKNAMIFAGALILALAGVALPINPAHAQRRFAANYTIYVALIPVGKFSVSAEVGASEYTISASGGVSGVARMLTSGESNGIARGTIVNGRLIPKSYASKSSFAGDPPEVNMEFEEGNVKKLIASPTGQDRVPLTEAHRQGVIDPLTALLVPAGDTTDGLAQKACQRTVAIFDGFQRYDFILAFKRMESVKAKQGYSGPAIVCSGMYIPIAGQLRSAPLLEFLTSREIEIALAPVTGTRVLVPFRFIVESWGVNLVVQANRFD